MSQRGGESEKVRGKKPQEEDRDEETGGAGVSEGLVKGVARGQGYD